MPLLIIQSFYQSQRSFVIAHHNKGKLTPDFYPLSAVTQIPEQLGDAPLRRYVGEVPNEDAPGHWAKQEGESRLRQKDEEKERKKKK